MAGQYCTSGLPIKHSVCYAAHLTVVDAVNSLDSDNDGELPPSCS